MTPYLMSQNFWDGFWSNLFSNLAVVLILAAIGYLSRAKIVRDVKKFIASEVDETIKQIKDEEKNE